MDNWQMLQEIYFANSLKFNKREKYLKSVFNNWLPDSIIDAHAHCNLPIHVKCVSKSLSNHIISTFPGFSLKHSSGLREAFYGNKTVKSLRFCLPVHGIDIRGANEYLLSETGSEDRIAVAGVPTDIGYTTSILQRQKVSALKMYHWFFNPPVERIYEFFKPEILEEAQAQEIPIILHLPETLANCFRELTLLFIDFPNLRVIIPHMGIVSTLSSAEIDLFWGLAKYEKLFLDTSMVFDENQILEVLKRFPSERIMFGSDEPLNIIRASVYNNPRLGPRLATLYPYHWANPKEQEESGAHANDAVHLHWQALSALRSALDTFFPHRTDMVLEKIFYSTAKELFSFDD